MKKLGENEFDGQKLIDDMWDGHKEAVVQGLKHSGALYRANGIINAARYQMKSNDIIQEINSLLKDDVIIICGVRVCDFAIAALDILGYKKYHGDDEYITRMILSKFDI